MNQATPVPVRRNYNARFVFRLLSNIIARAATTGGSDPKYDWSIGSETARTINVLVMVFVKTIIYIDIFKRYIRQKIVRNYY